MASLVSSFCLAAANMCSTPSPINPLSKTCIVTESNIDVPAPLALLTSFWIKEEWAHLAVHAECELANCHMHACMLYGLYAGSVVKASKRCPVPVAIPQRW